MLWDIKYKLRRLSKRAEPDRRFAAALKKELTSGISRPSWRPFVLRPLAATASLATVLGLGTISYAYASDDVLPDHPLYPVREQVERLETALAVRPQAKAAVKLKHLERRVREMEIMAQKKRNLQSEIVKRFAYEFNRTIESGEALDNGEQQNFDQAASRIEQRHIKVLQQVGERLVDEKERERLEGAMREETGKIGEKLERLNEKRRAEFERQIKRREAVLQQLPWRIENGDLRVLPEERDEGVPPHPAEPIANERLNKPSEPPRPRLGPKRPAVPLGPKLRNLIERGRLKVLQRPDGGLELAATSSTPAGIRLLLKDVNQRLQRQPGLLNEFDGGNPSSTHD